MTSGWSLRGRLQRRVLLAVCVGWLISLGVGIWAIAHESNEMLDEAMEHRAALTLRLLALGAAPASVDPGDDGALRVIDPAGAVLRDAPWPKLAGDGDARVAGWHVRRMADPATGVVVELGQAAAARRKEVRESAEALLLLMLPLLLVVLFVLRRTVAVALIPAVGFAENLRRRPAGDLSEVAGGDLPRELIPIPDALNGYLRRIDVLVQAERQFAANAAHELRTPLAAASAQAQLIAAGTASADAPQRLTESLARLARLVERLLQLSRAESGFGAPGECDLIRVIRLVVADIGGAGEVIFDDADLAAAPAAVDADVAALILGNLIRNAVDHGTGRVHLRIGPGPSVQMSNPVREDAAFHPARFAKGPRSSGAGLGLVIVETLALANGIALDFAMAGGVATVTVGFPGVD